MWHSQFISRGASYSWWRLTLGDFKGSQIWKILTHQREKNLTEIFSPVLCCWWSEGPEGFTMAGERGATLGGRDSGRILEHIALESGWLKKPREVTLAWILNYVCDLGQTTCLCWVSMSPFEMEVLLKRRWEFWNQTDLGWNLGSTTC